MTIATRRLAPDTFSKTEMYLKQAGQHQEDNMYFYQLEVQGGADGGLVLDALIDLNDNRIAIKTIWVMEYNRNRAIVAARNIYGEKGCYAKILGEKYLNRFFEHLANVDIGNVQERQYMLFDGGRFFTVIGTKEDLEDGGLLPVTVDISQPSKPVIVWD